MNRNIHIRIATPTIVTIKNMIFCESHGVALENRPVEAIVSFAIFAEWKKGVTGSEAALAQSPMRVILFFLINALAK
jgi:hypothetical protein